MVTAAEAERLLERAEGNPFFLEEIVRWRAAQGAEAIAVPETVEGVILARIDRLEEDVKEVLKVASVVGRSFLRRVLEVIVAAGIELDAELGELLRIELIRERRRLPELEYLFTHALVQEATYGSILRQRRLELHRRVGECIERLFPERLDEFYGLLAHHYGQAEDWPKAHEYLLKAADEAGRIAANAEALGYYRRALETHAQVFGDRWEPVERAALERGMGEAFFRLGRHEEAREHLYRALDLLGASYPQSQRGVGRAFVRELARQMLGRPFAGRRRDRSSGPADWERCGVYGTLCWIDHISDPQRFGLDSLLLLNLSERRGITRGMAYGSATVGLILANVPLDRAARGYRERSRALAGELGDPLVMGDVLFVAALGEHVRGHWSVALDGFAEAERRFREAGELRGWGTSATMRAYVLLNQQSRFDECLAVCDEIERLARDASDPQLLAYALHTRGVVLLRRGDFRPARELCREAVDLYGSVPDFHSGLRALSDVALCNLRLGRIDEATAAAEESEAMVVRHGIRGFQPVNAAIAGADVFLHLAEQGSEEALGQGACGGEDRGEAQQAGGGGQTGRPPRPRQRRMAARTARRGAALVAAQPRGRGVPGSALRGGDDRARRRPTARRPRAPEARRGAIRGAGVDLVRRPRSGSALGGAEGNVSGRSQAAARQRREREPAPPRPAAHGCCIRRGRWRNLSIPSNGRATSDADLLLTFDGRRTRWIRSDEREKRPLTASSACARQAPDLPCKRPQLPSRGGHRGDTPRRLPRVLAGRRPLVG